MKTLYDNRLFRISQNEHGGLWIDNNTTNYTTSATIYDDNTVGYSHPGVMTKASRRAINSIVERQTGKPALVKINILGEHITYEEYYNL